MSLILEKPEKISLSLKNDLEFVKMKILFVLKGGIFLVIQEFEIEEKVTPVTKRDSLFGPKRTVNITEYYLKSIYLWSYNVEEEFWGTYRDYMPIEHLFNIYNLRKLRKNYENHIKNPLKEIGFEIKRIDKETEEDHE